MVYSCILNFTSINHFIFKTIAMATGFYSPLIEACGDTGSALVNEHNG